jgi:hypothetical protein
MEPVNGIVENGINALASGNHGSNRGDSGQYGKKYGKQNYPIFHRALAACNGCNPLMLGLWIAHKFNQHALEVIFVTES